MDRNRYFLNKFNENNDKHCFLNVSINWVCKLSKYK